MMQMTLLDWKKCAPKRPQIFSEEVAMMTAESCRGKIAQYLSVDNLNAIELDAAVIDVGKALYEDGYYDDAYKVCRCLESYSWGDGDDELHDMISGVINERQKVWYDAVNNWVEANGITPDHKVGDVIKYGRKRLGMLEISEGEVIAISPELARYHVVVKGEPKYLDRVHLVNFEDVVE